MARKVLISLVGGRPLPNVQFTLNEKPKKWKGECNIDFVYGDDLLNITDKIKRAKEDNKSRI